MTEAKPQLPATIVANIDRFTGRTWLLPSLLDWLEHGDQRIFLLTGDPGTGKSMISAWLAGSGPMPEEPDARLQLEQLRIRVKAIHFCIAASGSTDPKELARQMADQLTRSVPGFGQALAATMGDQVQIVVEQHVGRVETGGSVTGAYIANLDLRNLSEELSFNRSLRDPLKRLYEDGYSEPILLLVDALDEAQTYSGQTNLVHLLAKLADLPQQVRILATTRDDPRVTKNFRAAERFDLITDAPPGVDDVRAYALGRLAQAEDVTPNAAALLAGRIASAARGIFLYAALVLDDPLPRLPGLPDVDPEKVPLPDGLSGLYHDFLNRELGQDEDRWYESFRPVLGLIAVARGDGLTRAQLATISGREVDQPLRICKQYLAGELPDGPFRVFHKSFGEFLTPESPRPDFYVDTLDMNLGIVTSYVNRYAEQKQWDGCDDYGLRYLTDHLIDVFRHPQEPEQAKRQSDASSVSRQLLAGDRFLLAKARRFGLWAATEDLSKLKGIAPGGRFDAGVTTSAEGFVIRVLLDCVRRPQAWTRTTDKLMVETLIGEAEYAGEDELLPMLSDIKNGMRIYRRAEIAHASPQAVFDVFAEPEGSATWIEPRLMSLRPKPAQAHALRVDDEICGWRVVAAETGRMVQLQNIADQGMWQHIATTRETDTTSRLLLVRVLPLNRRLAFSDLGLAVFPVILAYLASLSTIPFLWSASFMFAMGSDFLSIIAEWDRDVLRRIARLAEARNQVDLKWQKALCRDYTGGSLLVGAGIVLSAVLMLLGVISLFVPFVFTNVMSGPLALLALAIWLSASALNLVWLRQARGVEHVFGVTLPGEKILQVIWRIARLATILMLSGVILILLTIILRS